MHGWLRGKEGGERPIQRARPGGPWGGREGNSAGLRRWRYCSRDRHGQMTSQPLSNTSDPCQFPRTHLQLRKVEGTQICLVEIMLSCGVTFLITSAFIDRDLYLLHKYLWTSVLPRQNNGYWRFKKDCRYKDVWDIGLFSLSFYSRLSALVPEVLMLLGGLENHGILQ